jgi:light-harvesting complex I chlorophyll a/b binding protein 1
MRTYLAAGSLIALAVFLFGNAGSNLFATTAAAPSAYAYAPAMSAESAPFYVQQPEQMQYVSPVPYVQPVAYAEQAGPFSGSRSLYAAVGALLVGAVVAGRSRTVAVAAAETESAKNAALIATLAVSGRSLPSQNLRAAAPMMFFGGDPNKYDPRVNFSAGKTTTKAGVSGKKKTVVTTTGLFSSGVQTKSTRSKKAISSKRTGSTFIDVTGGAYEEVDTFIPQFDEVGVLPPLGRWDPLRIREQGPERYRRFVEMEIKHGRLAMAGFLGVLTTYSGVRFPGYLSKAEGIKFEDIPGGAISSWAALPTAAWFQIVIFITFCEINFLKQDPNKEPGDVVPEGIPWARYPDGYDVWLGDGSTKQVGKDELILGRTWKLNAERNNGRAAMMGMTGLIIHEALTGNPFFPIGESL